MTFACSRCGQCCRRVAASSDYADLDRGDGACRHLDDATDLCTIYETRPLRCRIDETYDRQYASVMPRAVFYAINEAACRVLQA